MTAGAASDRLTLLLQPKARSCKLRGVANGFCDGKDEQREAVHIQAGGATFAVCIFRNNIAESGAVFMDAADSGILLFANCSFLDNYAQTEQEGGGAGAYSYRGRNFQCLCFPEQHCRWW